MRTWPAQESVKAFHRCRGSGSIIIDKFSVHFHYILGQCPFAQEIWLVPQLTSNGQRSQGVQAKFGASLNPPSSQ